MQKLYDTFRHEIDFFWIYVREAHPSDGLRPARHVEIAQPKTFSERQNVAGACSSKLKLTIPILVDDMADTVARAYNALPDRLFLIGADAKIAYRGDRGPRGFKVDELEKAIQSVLQQK